MDGWKEGAMRKADGKKTGEAEWGVEQSWTELACIF